jgi:hypothetical protein
MTATADRIARLRDWCAHFGKKFIYRDDVLALCDDYETLVAEREREATRRREEEMTTADRTLWLKRLRAWVRKHPTPIAADVLALCDDYETLAEDHRMCDADEDAMQADRNFWRERATLSDDEREAVLLMLSDEGEDWIGGRNWELTQAVLRRLVEAPE